MLAEKLEKATDAIYETVDCAAWPEALDRVAALFSSETAVLLGFENVENLDGRHHANARVGARAVEAFCGACKAHGADAFRRLLPALSPGELHPLSSCFAPAAFRTTPVYDGMRRAPVPHEELFTVLHRSPRQSVLFGVINRGRRSFSADELAALRALVPHLSRAARLRCRLEARDLRAQALERIFESCARATLLLDAKGRIVLANPAAELVLESGDGVAQRDGVLHVADGDARARYLRLLRQAVTRPAAIDDDVIALPRASGRRAYVLRLTPLRIPHKADLASVARVAVSIVDPAAATVLARRALERALELTPAEARVAAAFASTGSLADTAAALLISVNTVKTHLSRILTKTGTRNQADLMRLLMQVSLSIDH